MKRAQTKVIVVDSNAEHELIGSLSLEVVNDFIYLGSNITHLKKRVGDEKAKSAMSDLDKIWKV